jgi:hypothetical protein
MGSKIFKSVLTAWLIFVCQTAAAQSIYHGSGRLDHFTELASVGKHGSAFYDVDWRTGIITTVGRDYCDDIQPMVACSIKVRYDYQLSKDHYSASLILEEETDLMGGAGDGVFQELSFFLEGNRDWRFKTYNILRLSDDLELITQYRKTLRNYRARLLIRVRATLEIVNEIDYVNAMITQIEKSPELDDGGYFLLVASTSCGASACGGWTTLYRFYP